jgi:hypothetical protein
MRLADPNAFADAGPIGCPPNSVENFHREVSAFLEAKLTPDSGSNGVDGGMVDVLEDISGDATFAELGIYPQPGRRGAGQPGRTRLDRPRNLPGQRTGRGACRGTPRAQQADGGISQFAPQTQRLPRRRPRRGGNRREEAEERRPFIRQQLRAQALSAVRAFVVRRYDRRSCLS